MSNATGSRAATVLPKGTPPEVIRDLALRGIDVLIHPDDKATVDELWRREQEAAR